MRRMDFALGDTDIITLTRIILDNEPGGALAFFGERFSGRSDAGGQHIRCDVKIEGALLDELLARVAGRDDEACLAFLREHFAREIKTALIPHCVPVFEACYKPGQAEFYEYGRGR
jgi:hypothetical protein